MPLKWGKDPKEDKTKDPKEEKNKRSQEEKWEINRKSQWGHKNTKKIEKEIKREKGGTTTIPCKRSTLMLI